MIDLHCHILPGLDDGAQTIEESIQMAKAAVREGIAQIVATPHHQTSKYLNFKNDILYSVALLNQRIKQENIPLEILVGQEVRIFGEWITEYENDLIAAVNDKNYVLIEFPANHVPHYTEKLFYDMQMKGAIPVIVHPERNSQIVDQPDKLFGLVEKGALSQINAGSITGDLGKKIQKFSFQLIEANLTHLIASDAHNTTTRPFRLSDAYKEIEKHFGVEYSYLYRQNAEYIVKGN